MVEEVGRLQFVCPKNRWAGHEWNGDWSDNSPLWTPALKKQLNVASGDDGIFWMSFKDFVRMYGAISICHPLTGLKKYVMEGRIKAVGGWKAQDQWLMRFQGRRPRIKWSMKVDILGGAAAQIQAQDGKRISDIYVGYPTLPFMTTPTNQTYAVGVVEIKEALDKVWTMVPVIVKGWDAQFIFTI
jgi:hypothetical protein